MSSTSNPEEDHEGMSSSEQIRCPLCSHLQEPSQGGHHCPVTCAVCQLRFTPLARAPQQQPSPSPTLQAPSPVTMLKRDTDDCPSSLQDWLSGAPIEAKELTLARYISALSRNHPWLTRVAFLGLTGLVLYSLSCTSVCWFMQRSLRRVTAESEQARAGLKRLDHELIQGTRQLRLQTEIAAQEKLRYQQLKIRNDTLVQQYAANESARRAAEDQFRQTARNVRLSLATKMTTDAMYSAERWPQRSLLLAAEALCIGQRDDQKTLIYPALQLIHDLTPSTASRPSQVLGPLFRPGDKSRWRLAGCR